MFLAAFAVSPARAQSGDIPLSLNLSASNASLLRDTAITPIDVISTGGDDDYTFNIIPALPAGLTFDRVSRQISGTPTSVQAMINHAITVSDGAGNSPISGTLAISINNPPLTITVVDPRTNFPRNYEIVPIIPVTTGGGGNTFSISPSLPVGLVFDIWTGTISGTPTSEVGQSEYPLTVTDNQGATAQDALWFGVRSRPVGFTFSTNTSSLIVGEPMEPVLANTTDGNDNFTFTVTPALPAGLSIDTATGTISSISEQRLPSTEFRVRVTERFFNASQFLRIEINNPELTIAYMQQTLNLTRDVQMTALVPLVNGGEPTYRYAISNALPEGLIFSEVDGSIFGTPTAALTETAFAVTVTDGATTTATTEFTLAVGQPAVGLALSSQTVNLIAGEEMTPVTSSGSGGDGTYTFAIMPALPDGMAIDTATGTDSGTSRPKSRRLCQIIRRRKF